MNELHCSAQYFEANREIGKATSDVTNGTLYSPPKVKSLTFQVNPNDPGLDLVAGQADKACSISGPNSQPTKRAKVNEYELLYQEWSRSHYTQKLFRIVTDHHPDLQLSEALAFKLPSWFRLIRAGKIKESLNVTFDETPPPSKISPLMDDDLDEEEAVKVTEKKNIENDIEDETLEIDEIVNIKEFRNHPFKSDERWIAAMQEELNQFIANNIWELARLVAQGYNQQEGVDYDETYTPVARLESIGILLSYARALDFKLFQMDVKRVILNDLINEKVYVAQPLGFIDFEKPNHVYKLMKALYGLKQSPKAWHDRLKAVLIKHEYKMEMVEMLKKFGLEDSKPMRTLMSSDTKITKGKECESVDSTKYRGMIGLWYPMGTGIETLVYADSDHAGDYVDRKSTSAKYVSARKACQQALWMKQAFIDYDDVPIMCDNKGAIDLSKNSVQHSRTKHIKIRHHFLRDNVQKGHISIEKVSSIDNIAEILMKPLKRESFNYLRLGLGMMEHIS
nr:copia protein [Tanacetum cinerariifolium]